ncbi:MAG: flagellar biosynthesis anti-sigma factor FlgM [Alphaproteobacteria bacterium HGW-Alphaproteobacteria-14]|nr:MAG: flagellar biosynthesis anti-sigma factor FlgM [Alphaproteobacteria bacterium HGW-Alphaproteobacteria-14]
MPSVELSKLPGINPVRALATGDRASIDARSPTASQGKAPAAGISVEVSAVADAATPPVDAERVEQIRAALRDGSYPLVPAKIADAMIAAQVSLSLPDQS